jgi:hypothetical protein
MADPMYSGSGSSSSGITTLLMVVAVVAVAVAGFNVYQVAQKSTTGFASSDRGNVTFEIESQIHIIFTNNLINWSTGYVNTTGPSPCTTGVEAQLSTDPAGQASSPSGTFCSVSWIPVLQGLTLQSDSNQDIRVNLTSDQNATTLIDGVGNNFGSNLQWKVSNNKSDTCNINGTGLAPTTYTEIALNGNVTICDSMNWGPSNDALDIDFLVNISSSASVLGERKAIITATAERSDFQYAPRS